VDSQKQLGQNVCKLRNAAKLTQEQLCEAANIDRSYLQRIEAGVTNPTFDVLLRLGKALRTSWRDLLSNIDLPAESKAPPSGFPYARVSYSPNASPEEIVRSQSSPAKEKRPKKG
jgi:transcriptional regulator with XRE-family HTH domain